MTDFALILNPKYKDIIPELWYEAGIFIPIVWNPFAESWMPEQICINSILEDVLKTFL